VIPKSKCLGPSLLPLTLYSSILTSGSLPVDWKPLRGGGIKYPVSNARVLKHLRSLRAGRWQKVIKRGMRGEVHYFEHASGQVAGVKHFDW